MQCRHTVIMIQAMKRTCRECKADMGEQEHSLIVSFPGFFERVSKKTFKMNISDYQFFEEMQAKEDQLSWEECERLLKIEKETCGS